MSMKLTEVIYCDCGCGRIADLSREHEDYCEDVALCSECECVYCEMPIAPTSEELRPLAHCAVKQVVNFREAIRNPVCVFTIDGCVESLLYASSNDPRLFLAAPVFDMGLLRNQVVPELRASLKTMARVATETAIPQRSKVGAWTINVVPFRDDNYNDVYLATLFTCSDSLGSV